MCSSRVSMPVIGWLGIASGAFFPVALAAFREGLTSQGYVEGESVAIAYRGRRGYREAARTRRRIGGNAGRRHHRVRRECAGAGSPGSLSDDPDRFVECCPTSPE